MRWYSWIICLGLLALMGQNAQAQFQNGDIIVGEFFDDFLRVNSGTVTDLYDIERSDNFTHLEIADSHTAYVVNFTEIWKIDIASGSETTLVDLGGVSSNEIIMGLDGHLLVSNAGTGISRVDVNTGGVSTVYDATFFNPSDICISSEGFIYVTEFFDGLGRVNTDGSWTKLGDWDVNFFSHLDLGPDGFLYATTTFEGGDLYRINPSSGSGVKIADDLFTFIDDLQVAADGSIYLAGATDTTGDSLVNDLVMKIDPLTGQWEVVVDDTMVGDPSPPFFNPMDLVIYDGNFYSAVPEPGSAVILVGLAVGSLGWRRRRAFA